MNDLRRRNKRILTITLAAVAGMIAVTYVSVPLYGLICKKTGWGGTTQRSAQNPNTKIYDREITVRFDSLTAADLPWVFKPDQLSAKARVGEDTLISYYAENKSDQAVAGTAIYNVTPLKAGKYFDKTQCFCFSEQVLEPKQKVHMPVVFFIDPKIMDDQDMADVHTITLSYTFYRQDSDRLSKAMEKFYTSPSDKK